jgi:pimeloyl-ACP methyl ester carboxylesterase
LAAELGTAITGATWLIGAQSEIKSAVCHPMLTFGRFRKSISSLTVVMAILFGCGGGGGGTGATSVSPAVVAVPAAAPTAQELQCQAQGWRRAVVEAAALLRLVLWQAPANWRGEAILVMHGGGGTHTNFCAANVPLTEPQVRFTQAALARGFAVFLLDSHDQVKDSADRVCGKVWDDEVRTRPNLDLPFIDAVLRDVVQAQRGSLPRAQNFLVGHSSGGYMATRAASHFGARITAFAPVAAGDPYGWTRDCTRREGDRVNVSGVGLDNDSGLNISVQGACRGVNGSYPKERTWDGAALSPKPAFRMFSHEQDGINDASCVQRVRSQLAQRGYPETPAFQLSGGARNVDVHYWLDAYNTPVLDFFASFVP